MVSTPGFLQGTREFKVTYEEKFAAINSLSRASLLMRRPGDWYVSQNVEIKDGSFLRGSYGNGITPVTAIEDHWHVLTSLKPAQYLVLNAYGPDRRAVRWNGFMWAPCSE